MTEDEAKEIQRWTAKRRAALVIGIIKGETSVVEAARKHGLKVSEVEDWQEKFLAAAENALRARPRDDEALKDEQLKRLKQDLLRRSGLTAASCRHDLSFVEFSIDFGA